MVMLCLAALAVLCWPPGRTALAVGGGVAMPSTVRSNRPSGAWRRRSAGRAGWVIVVLATSAVAVQAGVVACCAALLVTGTVARLAATELRRRRNRRRLGTLLVATRTLAREVRAGADAGAAVLATAAAHPDWAAELHTLATAVAGRRGAGAARDQAVGHSVPGGRSGDGGTGSRRTGRSGPADVEVEVLRRLGDSWDLSARFGVPWAALVDTVAIDLADRQRAASVRDAQVAGPRVSGYVLAVMPALGILLGAGMGADPVHVLLHTGVGSVLLLVGSGLTCLGLAWTASIVRA